MPDFTLHETGKNWSDAENDCQKEGGHLASVTSEEVNQEVKKVAAGKSVWLGGKKEGGEWTWSDKSAWLFTKWNEGQGNDGDGKCVFSNGNWRDDLCTYKLPFICQKRKTLKGGKTMGLTYTKDQLNFLYFIVWYKYKAASQQLLDSWKDKRMTGLRLSWRTENENPPLIARSAEVGRSIEAPKFVDTVKENLGASSLQ